MRMLNIGLTFLAIIKVRANRTFVSDSNNWTITTVTSNIFMNNFFALVLLRGAILVLFLSKDRFLGRIFSNDGLSGDS